MRVGMEQWRRSVNRACDQRRTRYLNSAKSRRRSAASRSAVFTIWLAVSARERGPGAFECRRHPQPLSEVGRFAEQLLPARKARGLTGEGKDPRSDHHAGAERHGARADSLKSAGCGYI